MATMNSIDSSKGRLRGTYIAIMIPLGVAINYVGGQIASSLGLPIYLDSIGTVIVAAIMGPWVGAVSYTHLEQLIHGALIEVQALAAQLQPFLVAEACAVDGALAGKLYRMI